MHAAGPRPLGWLYVAAPFSMGYVDFFPFLIPLYGLSLGLDASEIGILIGARSMLALFLSIHIGVLMDRFGTRAVTLVFVWTGIYAHQVRERDHRTWAVARVSSGATNRSDPLGKSAGGVESLSQC